MDSAWCNERLRQRFTAPTAVDPKAVTRRSIAKATFQLGKNRRAGLLIEDSLFTTFRQYGYHFLVVLTRPK
jgi:hypothetical protein